MSVFTKFSQKVRNLVSHRENNGMDKYTEFVDGIYTSFIQEYKMEIPQQIHHCYDSFAADSVADTL